MKLQKKSLNFTLTLSIFKNIDKKINSCLYAAMGF